MGQNSTKVTQCLAASCTVRSSFHVVILRDHRSLEQQTKTRQGSLAEYVTLPAEHLALRPANITPTQAAGVPLVTLTAYQALFEFAKLEPGQSLFVNGGSTSVGAAAIQLAKSIGCKVTTTTSSRNEEFVKSLGADVVRTILSMVIDCIRIRY